MSPNSREAERAAEHARRGAVGQAIEKLFHGVVSDNGEASYVPNGGRTLAAAIHRIVGPEHEAAVHSLAERIIASEAHDEGVEQLSLKQVESLQEAIIESGMTVRTVEEIEADETDEEPGPETPETT